MGRDDNTIRAQLAATHLLEGIPSEVLDELADRVDQRRLVAGEVLCREGEEGLGAFLATAGRFRVERQGRDVILVSMSIDPARDIPRRMKREAKKFKAKPGWYYLTGKKQIVNEVLKGLDAYFVDFEDHPPMALIGDGKTGTWRRFSGFPMPQHLLAMIDELEAARE